MEHIKLTTLKTPRKKDIKFSGLIFKEIYKIWEGTCSVIIPSIELLPNSLYTNNRILDWYEKILRYHNKNMYEFNKLFGWQKK